MGTPTTFSDYRLSSATLEITELILGKSVNPISVVPFHSIRSSVTLRLSLYRRWCEWGPTLSRPAPFPTINSVRSIAGELRRPSHASLQFRFRFFFVSATALPLAGGVRGVPL
jgi:hypothetical protein